MHSQRFDALVRSRQSRRTIGGGVLGFMAGLLGLGEAAAAPCPKGKKRCKRRCIPKRNCCTNANCRPRATGRVCRRGRCVCPPARPRNCNGVCIAPSSCCFDGECANVPNATTGCRNRTCVVTNCPPDLGDCNGNLLDGCETDLTADRNCGRCGVVCPGTTPGRCQSGVCRLFFLEPGRYHYAVPANGSLRVFAAGAEGKNGGFGNQFADEPGGAPGDGARGGRVIATFAVTAGEELYIYVGGQGTVGGNGGLNQGGSAGAGGFNGFLLDTRGAAAADADSSGGGGGGGGGSSDVRRVSDSLGDRIVMAGGGGGGGGGAGGRLNAGDAGNGGAGGDGGGADVNFGHGGGGGTPSANSDVRRGVNGQPGGGFGPAGADVLTNHWFGRGLVELYFRAT